MRLPVGWLRAGSGGVARPRFDRRLNRGYRSGVSPGPPPEGAPVPADGALPPDALAGSGERPFGVYVHVPFCVTRCGYCDFNTYTADQLGPGATRESYAGQAIEEIRLARKVLGAAARPAAAVFFGGGTPTLLPPADLAAILAAIDGEFGLVPGPR